MLEKKENQQLIHDMVK